MAQAQFCIQCGAKLMAEASFCVECGAAVPGTKRPSTAGPVMSRYAPAVVLAVIVVVAGGAVSIGVLNPKPQAAVPGRQATAPAAPAAPEGQMPQGHPPIELPADVKETIQTLVKSADEQPDNVEVWQRAAEVQYRAGQVDPSYLVGAQRAFEHLLERQPDNIEVMRSLGNIGFDREQPEMAIEYYNRYLKLKPDDANVQTDLATMQLAAGKTDEAIASYQRILAANPAFFQAQFNLGLAYFRAGKPDEASAALKKASELATDDRGRKQVEMVLARMQGGEAAPSGAAPAPNAPAAAPTLQAGLEAFFRGHQIMAPKVDRFDWQDDTHVRVLLREFPMAAMPDFARKQLDDRIRAQIKQQKDAHQVTRAVQVELVDSATGAVMDTVSD